MPRSRPKLELIVNQRASPSRNYLALTRNPDLDSPARFEPTVKGEGDVVL